MRKMGFQEGWILLVMRCVASVSYSVLINRSPSDPFSPGRGLRQGDPLSLYLFLLCTESLSGLLNRAVSLGKLHGVRICGEAPVVSHLLFTNDSLLFLRAKEEECVEVRRLLGIYEQASGQVINLDKSEVSFSGNVADADKGLLSEVLGVGVVQDHGKSLGLSLIVGRSKEVVLEEVKDRLWKKLNGWKEKFLSIVDGEVLIKVVCNELFLSPRISY